MAFIESHQTLLGHPKTRKAARLLGIKRVHLVGHLHALWWWALDYADDGDLSRFDADVIADACEWEDEPETFIDALVTAGFLDRTGDVLHVHDWMDYAGRLVQRRQANAQRMRDARAAHVQNTSNAHDDTCEATVHNPTVPNQQNQTEPTKPEIAAAPREKSPRPVPKPVDVDRQNPIWDALVQETGSPATKNERSDFGETVSQLKAANATVDEIHAFPHWWYEAFPGATLTHRCYRDHLGKFRSAPPRPMLPSDIKNPGIRALVETRPEENDAIRAEVRAKNGRPYGVLADPRRNMAGGQAAQHDVLPPPVRMQRD